MSIKINAQGEVLDGGYATHGDIVYHLAKLLFGADANGIVTIPASLTAAPTSFGTATFVSEIKAKT